MSNKLIIACLAYMAASILGQVPSTATEPPPAVVRQVDHIIVHVDTVADAKALWSLFSEKLYLPVAWLPADYKGFFSGGVNVGNVNLEFVYSADESAPPQSTENALAKARFSGLGLEPEPLPRAVAELERLSVRHGQPDSYQNEDETGKKLTLWTTVYLDDLSKNMDIFLCEYSPDLFRMNNPPRRDIEENRRYLTDQLKQQSGGPLGIESVKDVVIETSDYEGTVHLWEKLLSQKGRASRGELHPASGPAIRLTPSARNGIQLIVVRVADLDRARRFLERSHLMGHDTKNGIAMDPARLMGIDVQLVQ